MHVLTIVILAAFGFASCGICIGMCAFFCKVSRPPPKPTSGMEECIEENPEIVVQASNSTSSKKEYNSNNCE